MANVPLNKDFVDEIIKNSGLSSLSDATIRETVKLATEVETKSGLQFVHMEMGNPGLLASDIAIEAEIKALKSGVASKYAILDGLPKLKKEISRFVKLFIDIDVKEQNCVPTVGSLQGSMILFMVADRRFADRQGTLFIDPGFPVQKLQCKIMGHEYMTFDVYDYRGDKLRDKLESYLKTGKVSTILYSNPNNPSWICFTEKELKIIGELATKYDVIVIEDLAYFGMDFRKDYSKPGLPPFQPSVAKYTDNYVLLISSSKSFSYAGQRVGMMVISDKLYDKEFPDLKRFYPRASFGYSVVYNTLYCLSSGVPHTAQYGLAAVLEAVNDGKYNFRDDVIEYGRRANIMKKLFIENGFKIVYDKDEDEPIADGFYFTISYPGMDSNQLIRELLYFGISAISLKTTESTRIEGLRACVSQISETHIELLKTRLKLFNESH